MIRVWLRNGAVVAFLVAAVAGTFLVKAQQQDLEEGGTPLEIKYSIGLPDE